MKRAGWMAALVGLAGVGFAGQLHVESFGLREVKAEGGTVLIGTVERSEKRGKAPIVTIKVTQLFRGSVPWRPPGDGGPLSIGNATTPPAIAIGSLTAHEIYGGVEWTDPHKSPIDRRLRGSLGAVPAIGTKIVMVPTMGSLYEMLALDAVVQRTLEILYDADPAARMKKETQARLEADLANPDLAGLAATELGRRGKISAKALLRSDPAFFSTQFHEMPPAVRRAFLREALPHTRTDRKMRTLAARVALDELSPELVPAVALLVNQLDWKNAEDHQLLESDVRIALLTVMSPDQPGGDKVDLSPFGDYLAESTLRRPDHRDTDDDLPKLLARCDKATRAKLAVRFLGAIHTSSRSRGESGDSFLLGTAVDLANAAPSAALWAPLAKLDPQRRKDRSSQTALLSSMVEIGVALTKHDPSFRTRVRDLLEPLMRAEITLDEETQKLYRDGVGETPHAPPAAANLTLRAGERKRIPSGERVSVKRTPSDLTIELTMADGSSEERTIDPKADWYREWYLPPYLVIVRRAGEAVNLRLTPIAADPAMQPADAFEMAKKICDKRLPKGDGQQDSNDYDGLFTYLAVDGDKSCKVRIGLRTKKVLP